jgi:hypothetical protein
MGYGRSASGVVFLLLAFFFFDGVVTGWRV